MAEKEEDCQVKCREDIRSLHSWSELAHETLLSSGVKENPENVRKYNTDMFTAVKSQPEENSFILNAQNGFSKEVSDDDIDDSDDELFFITAPENMGLGYDQILDSDGERNYASLPNFSSLQLDSIENDDSYVQSPWSLPSNLKDVVQQKPVNVCSQCNRVITQSKPCLCQQNDDNLVTRKSESYLKDLLKSKSPSKHIFKPKGINFLNRKHLLHQNQTSANLAQGSEEADQSEKVKNKIKSVWNNVKYGEYYIVMSIIQIAAH